MHAGKELENWKIEVNRMEGHELFKDVLEGDRITLIASTTSISWVNQIESASMQVWSVDNGIP